MANFNLIFHGMMLFAEDGKYCDILFPEIKEHDYRFGDPADGFPKDLAPDDYEIVGVPARARPDRFCNHTDKYLVLRSSEVNTIPGLRRIKLRAPLPNRIHFFRKIIPNPKRFGKIPVKAILNGTPTRLAIALPSTLYDVVVFHYRNVRLAKTSFGLMGGGQSWAVGAANLGLYAQTGRDILKTMEPGSPTPDMVHRTGINDLLHYASGGNGEHPTFELSKIGTASGELKPGLGLKPIHMLNLMEMDALVTNRSGCLGAAVSKA